MAVRLDTSSTLSLERLMPFDRVVRPETLYLAGDASGASLAAAGAVTGAAATAAASAKVRSGHRLIAYTR